MANAADVVIPGPKQQALPVAGNLFKSFALFASLLVSFALAQTVAGALAEAAPLTALWFLKWTAIALFATFDVMLLIGLGILAHDAVHRVFLPSAFWNDLLGGLLSAIALLPFYSNRQFHLTHHSHAHQPGLDPEEAMHRRPFWLAMTWGSVMALWLQWRVLFSNLRRFRQPRFAARAFKDLALMSVVGAFYFVWVPQAGVALAVSLFPILAVLPFVFGWRALSDHYGVPPVQATSRKQEVLEQDHNAGLAEQERRQREVSAWVVLTAPWLEWLWSNVNYHEVHHKYPWLSYRYLPQVFAATRDRHRYLVVNGYWRSWWRLRKRPYYSVDGTPR